MRPTHKFLLTGLVTFMLLVTGSQAFAQICNAGNINITTPVMVTSSCTVTGNIDIGSNGQLIVDYSSSPSNVFTIQGDLDLTTNGIFSINGGTLQFQQDFNRHRMIESHGQATMAIQNAELILNQGAGVKYMLFDLRDQSQMVVNNSTLNLTKSWLIVNFFDETQLTVSDSIRIPTEGYVKDSSTVTVTGPNTEIGLWLDMYAGINGRIVLPKQVDENDAGIPYSWEVGRDSRKLYGVNWKLIIDNARPGLGLESHEGTNVRIYGHGVPSTGELTIAYHVESGTQTLNNLVTGLQNATLGEGRLTLKNVHLGPIAWQIYAHDNDLLTINDSVVNEVGATTNANVVVNNSVLQFAGVAAIGMGSQLEVNDSDIYSQTVEAFNDGIVTLNNSVTFGGVMVAHDAESTIDVNGGEFQPNSSIDPCTLDMALGEGGIPICSPWLPPGGLVTRTGPGTFTCTGTLNCTW